MISVFVQEQKRYTREELCTILECTEEEIVSFIKKLKRFCVLKAVSKSKEQKNMSELLYEDIEVDDDETEGKGSDYYYVFTFVGVIAVSGRILKCYPKYIKNNLDNNYLLRALQKILKVIEIIDHKEQTLKMFNDPGEKGLNYLSVLLFLLYDYYENGLYTSTEEIIETNGEGEIFWDRTINETLALISRNRPYYPSLKTKKRIIDNLDYFRLIHECVLTASSNELKDAGLLDIFGIPVVDLTDKHLSDFGEKDHILYRIEQEMGCQFNTRKQIVLKTIHAYISREKSLNDMDFLSLYGTNSFNLVWEKICAEITCSQLDIQLGKLKLPNPLSPKYSRNEKLKDIIEKPIWSKTEKEAKDTFIPDIVTIQGKHFIIFDAKYYTPILELGKSPENQPGIEDVAKQYLYQLAYKEFIADHGLEAKNCFLMPTEKSEVEEAGEVEMRMFSKLDLENIKVRFIPAEKAYDFYISGEKLNISELNL